jgi:rhodanese-related sulfurtransferase
MIEVDVHDTRARLEGGAVLLDVRTEDEWDAGHVQGSTWIPLSELPGRYEELPQDAAVLVICRSGGRSARAAQALGQWGYDATNVAGGAEAWVAAGLPFVCADGSPGVVA